MPDHPGFQLLDVARQTFQNVTEEIYTLAQTYAEEYDMNSIKVAWTAKRGFHLSVKMDPSSLPDVFLQAYRQGTSTLCTTEDMASLSSKHQACVQEIYMMTGAVLDGLVSQLRKDIGPLLGIADVVALMDMLYSFAHHVSLSDHYVRPEFSPQGTIAVRQGYHPMSSLYCQEDEGQSFVPNNTFMGSPCRCCILTGPNMSGKSVYLRQVFSLNTILSLGLWPYRLLDIAHVFQVALITILAHTGSFVPAEFACLPPTDRVFTRVGTGDDMQTNQRFVCACVLIKMSSSTIVLRAAFWQVIGRWCDTRLYLQHISHGDEGNGPHHPQCYSFISCHD